MPTVEVLAQMPIAAVVGSGFLSPGQRPSAEYIGRGWTSSRCLRQAWEILATTGYICATLT